MLALINRLDQLFTRVSGFNQWTQIVVSEMLDMRPDGLRTHLAVANEQPLYSVDGLQHSVYQRNVQRIVRLVASFNRMTGELERSRQQGAGSGLGLAITRQLVQAHGGKIEVESKSGEGTTFVIELPA